MGTRRLIISAKVLVLACVALVAMQVQRPGAVAAPGSGHDTSQTAPARGGGQRGGGRADGPTVGPGTLMTGVWGSDPAALDSRGWGWMTKSYVSGSYKRPFYNRAKEMLFSEKQVTSYTISTFDPEFYCEVRKHYGYVWFEMQHSTMSWDNVAKMIAACPGPDGAAPMIRMPDQLESSIQKATDLGAIGLIFPTIRDGNQALEAARFSRFPPFGRRSSGSGQASRVWADVPGGYQNTYNDNVLVVVMLETLEGIINANEIASTFGIDVVIQGNNDLARFSGWSQTDPRYQALLTISRNATLKAGKFWGNAGAQYLTGNPLSPDVRFVQNGPSMDGWTPPARGRGNSTEEPTIGMPGRGRRGADFKRVQRAFPSDARHSADEERLMKKTMIAAALATGVMLGYSGTAWTQTDQKLPVAGYAPAKDIPGARELPSPDVDYKVVFSVAAVAKPEEIHPTLKTIALYLNTLAHNGVPAGHRHIAAVFHQGGGDAVLVNDVYKARHNGTVNPNIALLHELKQAGVDLRVCGQGLLGKKVDPKDVLPDVQVDLWAMTTMVNLQLRGYVRIGG